MGTQNEGKSYGFELRFKSKKHQIGSTSQNRRLFKAVDPLLKSGSAYLSVFETRCL
jgi:hypothetical protein